MSLAWLPESRRLFRDCVTQERFGTRLPGTFTASSKSGFISELRRVMIRHRYECAGNFFARRGLF